MGLPAFENRLLLNINHLIQEITDANFDEEHLLKKRTENDNSVRFQGRMTIDEIENEKYYQLPPNPSHAEALRNLNFQKTWINYDPSKIYSLDLRKVEGDWKDNKKEFLEFMKTSTICPKFLGVEQIQITIAAQEQLKLAFYKMDEPKRLRALQIEQRKKEELLNHQKNDFAKKKVKIETLYNEAIKFIGNEKIPEGIFSLSKAIKLDENKLCEIDLYLERAKAKFKLHDFYGSIEDIKISIEFYGINEEKLLIKGTNLYKLKDFEASVNVLSKLLETNQDLGEAYYFRGLSQLNLDQKEKGCKDLSKAGELGFFDAYKAINEYCIK